MVEPCPVCATERNYCFTGTILQRHHVNYFSCPTCGLLQTETPYWLEEAYSSAIADVDTGLVQRNLLIADKLSCLLFTLFGNKGHYLDIGGGYGLLTRLMRDKGFDFYWSDPHCPNIFAKGFTASQAQSAFTAITAFEVLEHIHTPIAFIQQHLEASNSKTLIFSTDLFIENPPNLDWAYYAFNTGQHITFYQPKTLKIIAAKLGLKFCSFNGIHLFSSQSLHPLIGKLITSKALSPLLSNCLRLWLPSKTLDDSEYLSNQSIEINSHQD